LLGHGSIEPQVLPKEVEALHGVDVASVSFGFLNALALTCTGGVYSWGCPGFGLLAAGHGTPYDIGATYNWLPRRIEALRGVRVRCTSAGGWHSCAVTDEGHVYTWGKGRTGALGHMSFEDEPLPKRVEILYDHRVFAVGVAAGARHTLVADAAGGAWGFGHLNAIGAWNNPTVRAMHDAEDGTVEGVDGLFRGPSGVEEMEPEDEGFDCFNFLSPRGRASISMPVRIHVDVRVRGTFTPFA
jgi:E3 ubiquitin-protein ligase HERC2